MDDGSKQGSGLKINTQSFTKEDVEFLGHVQLSKYNITSTVNVQKTKDSVQYYLYISSKSIPKTTVRLAHGYFSFYY